MERLTYFKDGYWRVNFSGVQYQADFVDRLAAYEDTGWTPEMLHKLGENAWHLWDFAQAAENMTVGRLKELAEADKDGRCVVLPCKVGDTVYILNRILGTDNTVYDRICARKIRGYGGNALNKVWLFASGDSYDLSIFPSEFGKTVFLTREEAEKALEEREGKA
nr:MAG TPA: hypothetical protein [Caudoviricetes sp.]